MTWSLAAVLAIPFVASLFFGSTPKPWTPPGYGKRRQTQWMKDWRKAAGR